MLGSWGFLRWQNRVVGLTIAAVQFEPVLGDVVANVRSMSQWMQRAADAGARLVVFPEAATTGYDANVFATVTPPTGDFGWLAELQWVADETGIVALVNTPVRDGSTHRLSTILVAPHQPAEEVYSKQHLFAVESGLFSPGSSGSSVCIDGIEVALSVCYDANFPEHAAAAAADGAIVYVNSGAYFPGGAHRRDLHYASRALDNGMYVIFSGLVGRPHDFIGGTAGYDPLGRVIERLGAEEGMVVIEVDPSTVQRVREEQRMWRDRRVSLGVRERRRVEGSASAEQG